MIFKFSIAILSLAAFAVPIPAEASGHDPTNSEPVRYLVRFGTMLGAFEPIAGEILCVAGEDCRILLSIRPEVTVRLRASSTSPRLGTIAIDCATLECGFANGRASIGYGDGVNRLRIYAGTDAAGMTVPPVLRMRRSLGEFGFTITP